MDGGCSCSIRQLAARQGWFTTSWSPETWRGQVPTELPTSPIEEPVVGRPKGSAMWKLQPPTIGGEIREQMKKDAEKLGKEIGGRKQRRNENWRKLGRKQNENMGENRCGPKGCSLCSRTPSTKVCTCLHFLILEQMMVLVDHYSSIFRCSPWWLRKSQVTSQDICYGLEEKSGNMSRYKSGAMDQ